jgi:hypothetical protein
LIWIVTDFTPTIMANRFDLGETIFAADLSAADRQSSDIKAAMPVV